MYKAKETDLPELKQIWKNIFKDTDEYTDLYFNEKFSPDKTYVLRDENKITSTLYYSDVELYSNNKSLNCAYICGIATLPEYRGRNQASLLINKCLYDLKEKNYDLAFLIPASLSLFDFYKKAGFEKFSYLNIIDTEIIPSTDKYLPFKDTDIISIYESFDGLKPLRTEKDFDVLNKCYGLPYTFSDGYIYAYSENNTLYAVEHSYKSLDKLKEKLSIIADDNIKNVVIKSHKSVKIGKENPFSVFVNFKNVNLPDEIYINLMLN